VPLCLPSLLRIPHEIIAYVSRHFEEMMITSNASTKEELDIWMLPTCIGSRGGK
jgi:hypothetical protein